MICMVLWPIIAFILHLQCFSFAERTFFQATTKNSYNIEAYEWITGWYKEKVQYLNLFQILYAYHNKKKRVMHLYMHLPQKQLQLLNLFKTFLT